MYFRKDSPHLLLALSAFVAFGPLATDMYLPALPTMVEALDSTTSRLQLSLSVYLAGFSIFHLVCGPVSDRFGRKSVMLAGLLLFTLASIGCALATTIESLLWWRFLQGVGACVGPTLARAMVRDVIPPLRLPNALATMNAVMALAPIVAPILGGWMLLLWAWPSIFWFLVAYTLLAILLLINKVPETLRERQGISPKTIAANYTELMANSRFRVAVTAASALYAGAFAFISSSSFILIDFMGVAAENFGWWFTFIAVGYMSGNVFTARYSQRFNPFRLMMFGAGCGLAAGLIMLVLSRLHIYHPLTIVLPVATYTAAVGIALPQAMARALTPFPGMAGTASSLLGFVQMGSAAVAAAALGFYLNDGEPTPLAVAFIICGGFSLLAFFRLARLDQQT